MDFCPYNDNGGGGREEELAATVTLLQQTDCAAAAVHVDAVQVKIGHEMMDITLPPPMASSEKQTWNPGKARSHPGGGAIYSVPW